MLCGLFMCLLAAVGGISLQAILLCQYGTLIPKLIGRVGNCAAFLRAMLQMDQEALAIRKEFNSSKFGITVLECHHPCASIGKGIAILAIRQAHPGIIVGKLKLGVGQFQHMFSVPSQ
jgi:hypothetical protein